MRSGGATKGRTRDRERRGPGQLLAPAHHGASQLTAQPAQLARSGRQVLLLRCILTYVSFIIVWLEPGSWRGPSVRSAAGTAHVRGRRDMDDGTCSSVPASAIWTVTLCLWPALVNAGVSKHLRVTPRERARE